MSVHSGLQPVWRPGTREIVYRGSGQDDRLAEPNEADHTAYAVHRDGRLPAFEAPEQTSLRDLRIVLDWMDAAGLRP